MSRVDFAMYQKIAIMTASLNSFISQASLTKHQINTDLAVTILRSKGIGNRVDVTV